MRTIEKILWYSPISQEKIELLKKWGFYNGTGADGVFFDDIIKLCFEKLTQAQIFDYEKACELQNDITQLVVRHDIDTAFKIGFLRSNLRLATGIYKLLHIFPFSYRIVVPSIVFYATNFTKKARSNYKK